MYQGGGPLLSKTAIGYRLPVLQQEHLGKKGFFSTFECVVVEENPNFLTIDMFINKEDMQFMDLTKGMNDTGLFWLQGEIA